MPQPGTEGPSDVGCLSSLMAHLVMDCSLGVRLAIFQKCQALIPLRFLTGDSLSGKALLPWQNATLTLNLGMGLELAFLAGGALYSNYLVHCPALS